MKRILIIAFLSISVAGFAQKHTALTGSIGLTLGNPELTDLQNNHVNANTVKQKQVLRFNLPIMNLDRINQTGVGGIVKIELGDKIALKENFDLSKAALSDYFKWETTVSEGKITLTGTLIKTLPLGFDGTAVFELQTVKQGISVITIQGIKAGANEKASDIPVYTFNVTAK